MHPRDNQQTAVIGGDRVKERRRIRMRIIGESAREVYIDVDSLRRMTGREVREALGLPVHSETEDEEQRATAETLDLAALAYRDGGDCET